MNAVEPVPIHRSITKPVLNLDMERPYLIIMAMLHGLLLYAYLGVIPVMVGTVVSGAVFFWVGKIMAKNDPQMIAVVSESLNYKGSWLSAHSHPLAPSARYKSKR